MASETAIRMFGRHGVDLEGLGEEEEGVELARIPHHGFAGGGAEQGQDGDLGIGPVAEGFGERRLRALALFLHLLEHGRFGELHADPDRHRQQHGREQERQPPAPRHESLFAHGGADAEDDEQRHEQAERRRGLDPGGEIAALSRRRVLGHIGRGAAVLAAEREALHEAQRDQEHRGGDAPGRIGRQDADQEGAEAHQGHGDQEGVFAADDVAEPAEDEGAERPHREARREGQQGEDEGGGRVDAGEEFAGQNDAERAVDVEVVPFEHGAERGGENHQPLVAGHAAEAARRPLSHRNCGHGVAFPAVLICSVGHEPAPMSACPAGDVNAAAACCLCTTGLTPIVQACRYKLLIMQE